MAFKWFKAEDGSVVARDGDSSVEFVIEAPEDATGRTKGYFSGYDGVYSLFVPSRDFYGTVSAIKKVAARELAKAKGDEKAAPRRSRSASSGTAKVAFWGGLAALGGLAAWQWRKGS